MDKMQEIRYYFLKEKFLNIKHETFQHVFEQQEYKKSLNSDNYQLLEIINVKWFEDRKELVETEVRKKYEIVHNLFTFICINKFQNP